MQKFFIIALLAAAFSCSQSFHVRGEATSPSEDYEEFYLKMISETIAPFLKPIFDQWAKNGPFQMGSSYGQMSFFGDLSDAFVRREASTPALPNVLDSFQKHMEQFKSCIDQTLAKTVDEVNVKQVQPIFEVLGDQLNKFSKAFEDLTATKAPV